MDCLICLDPIDKKFKIIKHSKCKYQLHIDCANRYNRCLYCHKIINKSNICNRLNIYIYRLYYNLLLLSNNLSNYFYLILINYFEYSIIFIIIYLLYILILLNKELFYKFCEIYILFQILLLYD
jgi:hypothetical protein